MRILLEISCLILIIAVSIGNGSETCDDSSDQCPMDCPFGVKRVPDAASSDGCTKCVCAERESLCETKKCKAGHVCKVQTAVKGCQLPDMCAYKAVCVKLNKKGSCPAPASAEKISSMAANNAECTNDSDCDDIMKCCKAGEKSVCQRKWNIFFKHNYSKN